MSNGCVGSGPGTSTIKLDELLAPRKRQDSACSGKVFYRVRYMNAAEVSSSYSVQHGSRKITTLAMRSGKSDSVCQRGEVATGVGILYL